MIVVDNPPRNSGRFVAGRHYSRATEIRSGERLSAATEFKPGQAAHNYLPVGSVRIRVEANTWLPRAWVKVAEPNVWKKRAVVVWESAHGPLRRGVAVHHKDRDSLNDSLTNLAALTLAEHRAEHHEEMLRARNRG